MIWDRERYIAHCNFEFTGREMFCELFGLLIGLEEEWQRQGASAKEIALTAFDWDYVLKAPLAGNCEAITGLTPRVLEETPEFTVSVDEMGRKTKLCRQSATIPLPMEYPVKTMDDWLKVKHWYEFSEERIDREALLHQKELRDKGYLTIQWVPGGFDEPRQLMGEEELCIACYEEPELIADMLETIGNCALPGFVDSKNEEKTERNAGYLVVSHSGGGMLRQGTRKGIRRTPANRGMRAHWVVKGLDISEDVCHGMCP